MTLGAALSCQCNYLINWRVRVKCVCLCVCVRERERESVCGCRTGMCFGCNKYPNLALKEKNTKTTNLASDAIESVAASAAIAAGAREIVRRMVFVEPEKDARLEKDGRVWCSAGDSGVVGVWGWEALVPSAAAAATSSLSCSVGGGGWRVEGGGWRVES